MAPAPDVQRTTMGWEVNPGGLRKVLDWLLRTTRPREIAITECGAAFPEAFGLADADCR